MQPSEELKSNGDIKHLLYTKLVVLVFLQLSHKPTITGMKLSLKDIADLKSKKELTLKNGFRRADVCWSKFRSDLR